MAAGTPGPSISPQLTAQVHFFIRLNVVPLSSMPPSIPGAKHFPGQPATVFETSEQKWPRLSPWARLPGWGEQCASWNEWGHNWSYRYRPYTRQSWTADAWTSDTTADNHHTAPTITWADDRVTTPTRPRADAPSVRNLTRGTTADALAALQSLGVDQMIRNRRSRLRRTTITTPLWSHSAACHGSLSAELPSSSEGSGSSARPAPRTA